MTMQQQAVPTALKNPISLPKLKRNTAELAYNIKVMVLRTAPEWMEMLDINNDEIFLDPLLFAWFNNMDNPDKQHLPTLEQLLYGYVVPEKRPEHVPVVFDQQGITYLSKIGYFKAETSLGACILKSHNDGYTIETLEGVPVPCRFYPPQYLVDFEVMRFNNPLFFSVFTVLAEGSPLEYQQIEVADITRQKLALLDSVILMLKQQFPDFYHQVKCTNRRLMMFNYSPINSFVVKNFHGTIFMNTNPKSGAAFFVDDLVHQWAHNILNTFIIDLGAYFKIDAEQEIMSTFTGQAYDDRDVYGAFHGLFTVTQRVVCFRGLYKSGLLSDTDRKELIARYCDQNRRFKSGLEKLDFDLVYTAKGKKLYHFLAAQTEASLGEIADLLRRVSFANQESRFSYDKFKEINNMDTL